MKLNPPKKNTFWAALVIAAASLVAFIVHLFVNSIPFLGGVSYLLLLVAFTLLCLGLTIKGL